MTGRDRAPAESQPEQAGAPRKFTSKKLAALAAGSTAIPMLTPDATPKNCPRHGPIRETEVMSQKSEAPEFEWDALVLLVIHPMRVSIIEALRYMDHPLSASDLHRLFFGESTLSFIDYHIKELVKLKVLVQVRKRKVRGATEKFYAIPSQWLRP